MRILAAGWHGQIASAFMQIAPGRKDISAFAIGRPGLDICEPRSVERALGDIRPDVLINLAGYTDVDGAESEPELALALNSAGARLLAEAAARRDVPIIHISTSYVFNGHKKSAYVETDQTAPSTIYGQSKLAGEVEVQKANSKHIILRTEWLHSPFGRCFVSNILQRAQLGMPLKVVNDQYGNPTYAPHLVDAILAVAAHLTSSPSDAIPWGVYHAAGTGTATWYDVAREVLIKSEQLRGLSFSLEAITSAEYLTRSHRSPNAQLDCSKLKQTFGVELPDWQEGVHECVGRLLAPDLVAV
ncbi:MAG TPA: dTDP-4-dehydrorhamnose reductase [Geobacterales bacterium]|nr:dTDP-4-dehydrorhamnose reductase [Geobacterales bacterium]